MDVSELRAEFADAAAEVEELAGEAFTFDGAGPYRGVMGPALVMQDLEVAGYGESAQAMVIASAGQFTTQPTPADAAARKIVVIRDARWKTVTLENDGLIVKFGLRLDQ